MPCCSCPACLYQARRFASFDAALGAITAAEVLVPARVWMTDGVEVARRDGGSADAGA